MIDIKLFRKDNNLSQVELAKILECTQGFISSLEKRRRPIPDNIITKLISSNKYNIRYLVCDPNETRKEEKAEANDEVKMSREVFDVLKNLSETVLSQQRTIEQISKEKEKRNVHLEENAECADASGSDLVK
jgi:transcriptional regulator with XRE-family HTH domain